MQLGESQHCALSAVAALRLYRDRPFFFFFFSNRSQLCVDDPSKTFWDDPKMYVDDPGLDSLLLLTADELLSCNGQPEAIAAAPPSDGGREAKDEGSQTDPRPAGNDGKPTLVCEYPNCDKSYTKPSHLKVSRSFSIFFFFLFGFRPYRFQSSVTGLFLFPPPPRSPV